MTASGRRTASRRQPGLFARTTAVIGSALLVLVLATDLLPAAASATFEEQAVSALAVSTVGPLFSAGVGGEHGCTASVLAVGRDLILTAAHCVSGTAAGVQFIPGYDGTKPEPSPFGVWTVARAWVPAGWADSQDPQDDYAILQVDDRLVDGSIVALNDVVTGNSVGLALPFASDEEVTIPAYLTGANDAQITCTAPSQIRQGYPSFDCGGYSGGTSGAPWITVATPDSPATVTGVIGGLNQGGCLDSTSYSSDFGTDIYVLILRATLGLPADTVPTAGSDGC